MEEEKKVTGGKAATEEKILNRPELRKKGKVDEKHVAAKEVSNVGTARKRQEHQEKQKDNGDKIVKWIFGVLIALAVIYMIWSFYILQ